MEVHSGRFICKDCTTARNLYLAGEVLKLMCVINMIPNICWHSTCWRILLNRWLSFLNPRSSSEPLLSPSQVGHTQNHRRNHHLFLYTFEITQKPTALSPTDFAHPAIAIGGLRAPASHPTSAFKFDVITLMREFLEGWLTKRGQDASLEDVTRPHMRIPICNHWTDSCLTLPKIVPSLSTLRVSEARPNTLASWSLPSTEPLTSRYRTSIMSFLVHCRLIIHI